MTEQTFRCAKCGELTEYADDINTHEIVLSVGGESDDEHKFALFDLCHWCAHSLLQDILADHISGDAAADVWDRLLPHKSTGLRLGHTSQTRWSVYKPVKNS